MHQVDMPGRQPAAEDTVACRCPSDTEMGLAARRLANSTVSKETVHALLRWTGCRGIVGDLQAWLARWQAFSRQLANVARLHPALGPGRLILRKIEALDLGAATSVDPSASAGEIDPLGEFLRRSLVGARPMDPARRALLALLRQSPSDSWPVHLLEVLLKGAKWSGDGELLLACDARHAAANVHESLRNGRRPSSELTRRELTCDSLQALGKEHFKQLARLPLPVESDTVDAAGWGEPDLQQIVTIALSTARTVGQALRMRLIVVAGDAPVAEAARGCPGDVLVLRRAGPHAGTWWRTPQARTHGLHVQLSVRPPRWPEGVADCCVHELFPWPVEESQRRVGELLGRALRCTPGQADLRLKHALARSIFADTCNRAIIDHLCAPPRQDDPMRRSSLAFYIDARAPAIPRAYLDALRTILDGQERTVEVSSHGTEATDRCTTFSSDWMRALVAQLAKSARSKRGTWIERHRRFALYVAAMSLLALGHRESAAFLPFAFDLDLEEGLAFLADKILLGSEARFVPLAGILVDQLAAYRLEVCWMLEHARGVKAPVAREIEARLGIGPVDPESRGLFFLVEPEGKKLRPISTQDILDAMQEAAREAGLGEREMSASLLRRNLATFLANERNSGYIIATLLGHNESEHVFGKSSSWWVLRWMRRLRPELDRYLALNGLEIVRPPSRPTGRDGIRAPISMPRPEPGNFAYEGRALNHDEALDLARGEVGDALALLLADCDDIEIDEAIVEEIRTAVAVRWGEKSAVCAKVRTALVGLVDGMRKSGRLRVTAASLNIRRYEEGVVDPCFGRHLAVARAFRARLPGTLADYLSRKAVSSVERLAAVLVLAVCEDATLNPREFEPFAEALQRDEPREIDGAIHVRAEVVAFGRCYARTWDPLTPNTALAVSAYWRLRPENEAPVPAARVLAEASALVRRVVGREAGIGLDLQGLAIAMRPYWLLRLPGALFAAVTGRVSPTAPSEDSWQLLMGAEPRAWTRVAATESGTGARIAQSQVPTAEQALRSLMHAARGVIEAHQTSSRAQRARLGELLDPEARSRELHVVAATPAADLWLQFLAQLLEDGGPRARIYRFSTIDTYQRRVLKPFLRRAEAIDLFELSSTEWDAFHAGVVLDCAERDRPQAALVMRLFHRFMMAAHGARACASVPWRAKEVVAANAIVLPDTVVEAARRLALAEDGSKDSTVHDAAAGLLTVNHAFGLRTMEGFGLQAGDIDIGNDTPTLWVRRNRTRSLKTLERHVTAFAGPARAADLVKGLATRLGGESPREKPQVTGATSPPMPQTFAALSIFADPADPERLVDYRQTAGLASFCLKSASGNPAASPYCLRHGFATAVMLKMLTCGANEWSCERRWAAALKVILPASLPASMYPYQVDRAGYWMGHAGAETILNTYAHGLWISASAHCAAAPLLAGWTDAVTAALLGKERSTVTKRRQRCLRRRGHDMFEQKRASHDHVMKSFVGGAWQRSLSAKAMTDARPESRIAGRTTLRALDAHDLLMLRVRQMPAGDVDEFIQLAHARYDLAPSAVERFLVRYGAVAERTGLHDFEPGDREGSALLRGVLSRRGMLARIDAWVASRSRSPDDVRRWVAAWVEDVRDDHPLLLSRSEVECRAQIAWLARWDVSAAKIDLVAFRAQHDVLDRFRADGVNVDVSDRHLGRMRPLGAPMELGLSVRIGAKGSGTREFHRVLFAFALSDFVEIPAPDHGAK